MAVEGEVIQTKGIDNLLNRIMAKISLSSRKRESPMCRKLTEHQTNRTKTETPADTQSKHSAHRTKKEF
jgi:hypothetical protein